MESASVCISFDHRLDKGTVDHIHLFFAVFIAEVLRLAAHDRRKLGKVSRNRPVQCDVGEWCLRTPAARCIYAVYKRFDAFLDFQIVQIVHFDKRCQIRVKRRKCLCSCPFILHDAEEIDHLIAKYGQMFGRCRCDLALNAAKSLCDQLF